MIYYLYNSVNTELISTKNELKYANSELWGVVNVSDL